MNYQCEVLDQENIHAACVRTRCSVQDLPTAIGKSYASIMTYLSTQGNMPNGAPYVAYFNMDMNDLKLEIGLPVPLAIEGNGEVQPGKLSAGKYAATIHVGPYSTVEPAYAALSSFLEEHGYASTGIAYEFYLNDPQTTPPEELQTKIMFPLI